MNSIETYASVIVKGEGLDPQLWTSLCAVEPDGYGVKGELPVRKGQTAGRLPSRESFWSYGSQNRVTSAVLDEHVVWLLETLQLEAPRIQALRVSSNLTIEVFCFYHDQDAKTLPVIAPVLSDSTLAMLNRCKASYAIDCYPQTITFVHPDGREETMIV